MGGGGEVGVDTAERDPSLPTEDNDCYEREFYVPHFFLHILDLPAWRETL